jgi:hypothetical protein
MKHTYGWCRSCRIFYYKLFDGVCRDCLDHWEEFPRTKPGTCPKTGHSGHTYLQCPHSSKISETGYVSY